MDIDYAITFMSSDWIIANSLSLVYLITCLLIGKYSSKDFVKKFAIVFVYFFIVMYILFHYFHFIDGSVGAHGAQGPRGTWAQGPWGPVITTRALGPRGLGSPLLLPGPWGPRGMPSKLWSPMSLAC